MYKSAYSLREASEDDSTPFLDAPESLKTYPLIKGNISPLVTGILLMAAINGAAILALPNALKNTGWVGLALFSVSCSFSLYTGTSLSVVYRPDSLS